VKPLRLLISSFWFTFAAALIVLAILLSAARLLLPSLGEYRGDVARWVGDILGQPVQIGELGASWHNWGPSVDLRKVTVLDAAGRQPVLQCAAARIDINLLASLRHWQFEPGLLTVQGLHLSLVRHEDGNITVVGLGGVEQGGMQDATKGAFKQWLQRQERLAIEQSSLQWRDLTAGGKTLEFTNVNLQLRNLNDRHRLDGTVDLPQTLGQSMEVAMDVRGDLFTSEFWQGQVYARGNAVRLGGWREKKAPLGLTALDGVVDFQVWSEWLNGVQQVEGDIHARDVHATRNPATASTVDAAAVTTEHLDIGALEGGFHWQRRQPGWTLDVDNFSITRQGAASPLAQLRVEYTQDDRKGSRDVQAAYSDLRAEDVTGLLLDADLVPGNIRERLVAIAPHGILHDGYFSYHSEPQQAPRFVMRSDFSGLAWQPDASLPGMQGLAGRVTANEKQGVLTLATQKAAVDFAKLFRAPLPVDALAGRIVWHRGDTALQMLAQDMTVRNEDAKVQFGFRLDVPQDGGSPYLDLKASFDGEGGDHVSRYLPAKIMGPATVAWLDKAVVNGRIIDGTAHISGPLADFPFDDGQGLFEIHFGVAYGILEYAAGWPRLEEIETEILFHGRRFEANAAAAKSLSSDILQTKVVIPNLTAKPVVLTVNGTAQGPVADVLRYVTESPLHDKLGTYLDSVAAGGQSRMQLSLKLPLAKLPATVNGTLRFDDSSLSFRDQGLTITHIDGDLKFSDRGLAADGIHAELFGQAVTIAANTESGKTGTLTTFSAQGNADAVAVAKRFAAPLASNVVGLAPWRGELRIPPKSEGWVELQVESSLQGVAIDLPSPLAKTADETRTLLVQVPLPLKPEKPIHLRYGDIVDAQVALESGATGMQLARGEVRFGGGTAALSNQGGGLRLTGTLPEFDVDQWSAVLSSKSADKALGTTSVLRQVDMEIGTLKVASRQLDKVKLLANRGADAWDVDLKSVQVQGRIHLPDAVDAPIEMDMERLYLPRFKKGGGGGKSDTDPRKVHPLDIKAKSFHYADLDLGELKVSAIRTPTGLSFDEMHAHSDKRDLKVNGTWQMEGDSQQSAFSLAYNGEDTGATLTSLGFAGVIHGGKVHTDVRLKWPGAPTDFSLAKAAGSLSFEIKDGRLLDVEPGAGRILGLLSFQALPRHLLLDFSDLFQKGFSFDRLGGSFTIENGNAQTDNLVMAGPSARIEARGRVGLAAEDYDQVVTVTPDVSAGLPVAGALAAGVGAGAALFLMEKILKPGIDKITQVEYKVTGPWANPVVERIAVIQKDKKSGEKRKK
jgi:uncharacterized protein (TIGR02099 family)